VRSPGRDDAADFGSRPVASFARQSTDFDHLIGYLGYFLLEKPAHKVGMYARQNDAHAVVDFAHIEDERFDTAADVVAFSGDLFSARQNSLGLAQIDDGCASLEALDRAKHQAALEPSKLGKNRLAFGFADLLDDDLLGTLGGDAS